MGNMTHYMGLLASNQPWNLIIFMAIPVILAETVAITELYLLFTRRFDSWVRCLNKWAGIVVGLYFIGIFAYLMKDAVIPFTMNMEWRGPADILAVGFYLSGVIPLGGIALLDLGLLGKRTPEASHQLHATFVAIFLVVAHIAMIFGMLDPTMLGYSPTGMMGM